MEKRNYVKPVLNSEEFVPQVYCAACGDSEIIGYSGKCDTTGEVFWDSNNNGVYDEGTDEYASSNTAGDECSFNIDYLPTKNAFCFTEGYEWKIINGYNKRVGKGTPIYGARIEEYDSILGYTYVANSHFVANINNITEVKNLS